MMRTTEAHNCLFYVCPACEAANSIRLLNNPLLRRGFNCQTCRASWTVEELLRRGGFMHNREQFNPLAVEFVCDRCGGTTLIFTPIRHQQSGVLRAPPFLELPDLHVHMEGGPKPKFGLCEECNIGYELEYPQPGGLVFHAMFGQSNDE